MLALLVETPAHAALETLQLGLDGVADLLQVVETSHSGVGLKVRCVNLRSNWCVLRSKLMRFRVSKILLI